MLEALRMLNLDRMSLDECVALMAFGRGMKETFEAFQLEAPDWLNDNLVMLEGDIRTRRKDYLSKQLKTAEASLNSLKSAEDKRGDLRAKIEKLKSQIG